MLDAELAESDNSLFADGTFREGADQGPDGKFGQHDFMSSGWQPYSGQTYNLHNADTDFSSGLIFQQKNTQPDIATYCSSSLRPLRACSHAPGSQLECTEDILQAPQH